MYVSEHTTTTTSGQLREQCVNVEDKRMVSGEKGDIPESCH